MTLDSESTSRGRASRRSGCALLFACVVSFVPAFAAADELPQGFDVRSPIVVVLPAEGGPPDTPPAPVSAAELPPEEDGPYAPGKAHVAGRYSKGLRRAGTTLTVIGIAVGAVGGALLGMVASSGPSRSDLGYAEAGKTLGLGVGGFMAAGGAACVLVGVPLWIASGSERQ